ncbi:MAG: hypothetical protein J1E99_02250 [Muribaculaceae bacterium]|nr:hypothetical protein [Muribaculaceae bacterium]
MKFTDEEVKALAAMTKEFKCPVCGSTHIIFNDQVTFNPEYNEPGTTTPAGFKKTAEGRCSWCGMTIEFDMEQLMESYAKTLKQ